MQHLRYCMRTAPVFLVSHNSRSNLMSPKIIDMYMNGSR